MSCEKDTLVTLYAVFHYTQDKDSLQRFMEVHEQEITLLNMKTQSLFHPLKFLDISVSNMERKGDNLRSDKINTRGYTYSYKFVDIDYASLEMVQIIADSKNMVYDEDTYNLIFEKMKEYYGIELEKPPFSDFLMQAASGQKAVNAQNANMVWYADTETAPEEETEESDDSVFVEELDFEEEKTDSKENVWNVWFMMLMMLMMLCGIAVMIMSILLILFLKRRNDIRRSNEPDVILRHLLWIFGRKISPKEDSETLSEYFKKISSNELITEDMCAKLVIIRDMMEQYWYGKGHIGADDVGK